MNETNMTSLLLIVLVIAFDKKVIHRSDQT